MGKALTRQIAREAQQQKRSEIIERDFKDIKAKFPEAVKAFITFGGDLSQRMKEEAQRFNDGLPRSQVRQILSDRKAAVARHEAKIALGQEQQAVAAHKEQKQKTSVIRKLFRRGVA